ncbi:DHA2 family efflux MFS transporter permease subunit [Paenibacillus sp. FSL K6-1230]|uniref:DHA2 family efflux MFS transporter permease subunit n=1 Tax=Paenibacillus sp. FSL K6-1230 TaxID=2921603 RepID=UPI0030FAA9C4
MADTEITTSPPGADKESWLAFMAIVLGAFVAILNNSLINVAIPKLTTDLGSTTSRIQWVITGYTLASGVIVPITGYMEQKIGYKKFLILALSIFAIGTAICALAWSDSSLIAARVLAGLGGGVIMPLSMTIVYKIIPRHQIGMALGIWGIAAMAAPAVGPTLSGYLIEWVNWRFLFIVCLPVTVLAILLVVFLIKEPEKGTPRAFDLPGFVLAATCAGTLLYALSNGQSDGWTSFKIVGLLFIAVWSLIFLIYVESGKENAVIEISLFKNFKYSISVVASSLVMMGMYGGTFLTPLFLQNIQGVSPIETGIILIPQAVAMAVMMPIAGRLFDKYGIVPLGLVGLTLTSFMTYHLHLLTPDTSHAWLETVMALRGIGIGICMMPLSTVGMNAVHPSKVANASTASNLVRTVSASMAIAVFTSIMQSRSAVHAQHVSESITADAAHTFQNMLGSGWTSTVSKLIQLDAASRGIADTFLISSVPLFCAIPLILLFIGQRKQREQAS